MRRVNNSFLTPAQRATLASVLPVKLKVNDLHIRFIEATELAAERVNANRPNIDATKVATKRTKTKTVRTRFQEIDNAVTALKREMRELIGEPRQLIGERYKMLAAAAALETWDLGSARELLSRMRGDLDTLHKWCSTVVTRIEPDKADKTSKRRALWLAVQVATAHCDIYGTLPTLHRLSWFARYMDVVGGFAGVKVGHDIARQAVEKL